MDILLKKTELKNSQRLLILQKKCFESDYLLYKDEETSPYCENLNDIKIGINNNHHYTIYLQNKIIGAVEIIEKEKRYHLYKLFVDPNYQNLSIGKKTVHIIFEILDKNKEWTVYTPHKNTKNHFFYESLGFIKYGESKVSEELKLFKYVNQFNLK